jgi:O-antigen/teichoic acid export membrane protein
LRSALETEADERAQDERRPAPLSRVASRITVVNLAITATAVVTGPLAARALAPAGRGDLAAVLVTLSLAPYIADLGLSTFVAREAARGRALDQLVGSIVALSAAIGVVLALLGPLIAHVIAGGRDDVRILLIVGFALMPLTMGLGCLNNVNWALQRWRVWLWVRAVPPLGGMVVTVILFATDHLTVVTASVSVIALGLVANVALLPLLGEAGRPRWNPALARTGISFGLRAWLYTIAGMANGRLDQLLMTRMVSPAELGTYAVAVNATAFQQGVSNGIVSAIFPRVAGGDARLTMRATRLNLLIVATVSGGLFAIVGLILPLLFGQAFEGAVTAARILLVAAVVSAGTAVLSTGLTASGRPGASAKGQLLAILITVPGLIVLLPSMGGEGAALVSLCAYTVTFAFLLRQAVRHLGGGVRDYLIPRREDLRLVMRTAAVQRVVRALRRRGAP